MSVIFLSLVSTDCSSADVDTITFSLNVSLCGFFDTLPKAIRVLGACVVVECGNDFCTFDGFGSNGVSVVVNNRPIKDNLYLKHRGYSIRDLFSIDR